MVKKLQRKMFVIMMVSVFVVLSAIMITINVINYNHIAKDADMLINLIGNNRGDIPKFNFGPPDKNKGPISKETPYETRFFTLKVSKDGNIESINTGNVAAVDTSMAILYYQEVVENKKEKGYVEHYRYNFLKEKNMYVFVDCNKQLNTAKSFLMASIGISTVGMLAVFVLVYIFSNMAVKPVKDAYDMQKRFITDSSHEIKTPLAVIMASTEVIESINGESEWTDNIKDQVQRLAELNSSMTELARMDEMAKSYELKNVNITEIFDNVSKSMLVLAENSNKQVEMNIEENVICKGNAAALKQLMTICFDNAIKYSTSKIAITITRAHNKAQIIFENDTEGVKKGNCNEVFERFYRMDQSRSTKVSGSGIGLSVAKSIVERHNGRISALSEDGIIFKIVTTLNC